MNIDLDGKPKKKSAFSRHKQNVSTILKWSRM
jgi:hypothetical protein